MAKGKSQFCVPLVPLICFSITKQRTYNIHLFIKMYLEVMMYISLN